MAKVKIFKWKARGPLGNRVWKTAYGFTTQIAGKQIRRFDAAWSQQDALDELAKFTREGEPKKLAFMTFGQAVDRYLAAKMRKKTFKADEYRLRRFVTEFGRETPLGEITGARVSAWKASRLSAICPKTKELYSSAAVNRPLAVLRHLLRLAHEEWEVLPAVPKIRLEREPQGRLRWLSEDEEARLLAACAKSLNPSLLPVVTVALETGTRKSELLGLTWDRVDFSRGVIRLEVTKSGRRREIPMRQAVYDTLSALPGPREGRVWPVSSIRTGFENAVSTAKIEDFRFHDLRHTFASRYVMRGGSLPALQQILGHATLAMTMRYSHLSPKHLREEMEKTERQAVPGERVLEAPLSRQISQYACASGGGVL